MSELSRSPTASARPASPSSGETKAARHIRHATANARYLREMMPPAVKAEGAASKRAIGGTAEAADGSSFMVVEARAAPPPKQAAALPAALAGSSAGTPAY